MVFELLPSHYHVHHRHKTFVSFILRHIDYYFKRKRRKKKHIMNDGICNFVRYQHTRMYTKRDSVEFYRNSFHFNKCLVRKTTQHV